MKYFEQLLVVIGLLKTGVESASKMALSIARKYTNIEMTKNTYNFQQVFHISIKK